MLSAFEKGLQSQEADFREFAEQVKIHQRYGRLTSGVIQQISTLDDSAIDILPEFANSADNERLVLEATKSSTTIDIYRDVCKDLSPLVWLTKRRDQVRNQRLRQKGKKLKKSSSFFGSNRNDRDRFLDTDGLSDDEDEDDEYEKEVLQNTRVDADLNDVGRIRSQRSGKSRDDSPPFFDLSIVVAIFGVIFSSCGLIYEVTFLSSYFS